jgi:hypothetical protein
MSLIPAKHRGRPWSWTIDPVFLAYVKAESERDGVVRGIFFDTSGTARVEAINHNAQYQYLWKSNEKNKKPRRSDPMTVRQTLREFLKKAKKAKGAKSGDFYADFIEQLIDDGRVTLPEFEDWLRKLYND